MTIVWTALALERVQEIADYIAVDSVSAANNWIGVLFDKVDTLKSQPALGRAVPEIGKSDIRELIIGNYRVIYLLYKKQISILTVRHFKQMLPLHEVPL